MLKKKKLLIVEPDGRRQKLYGDILSEIPDIVIEVVKRRRKALDMLRECSTSLWECYDLVVMNAHPRYPDNDMGGIDFVEETKDVDVKIIMVSPEARNLWLLYSENMTDLNERGYMKEALMKGVYSYLTELDSLLMRIQVETALKLLYDQREVRELLKFGGQIEKATILFADIEGFTWVTGEAKRSNNSANIAIIVNRFLQEASRIIDENGGIVDKYIGDEIMAIFPKPGINGYGAIKALEAAIALRGFFKEDMDINARFKSYGKEFKINIGISIDEVISGSFGSRIRKDFTVFGEGVNLASRLADKAENGEILLSEVCVKKIEEENPEFIFSKENIMNASRYEEKWSLKNKNEGFALMKRQDKVELKNVQDKITIFEAV